MSASRILDTISTMLVAHSLYTYMVFNLTDLEADLVVPWYTILQLFDWRCNTEKLQVFHSAFSLGYKYKSFNSAVFASRLKTKSHASLQ